MNYMNFSVQLPFLNTGITSPSGVMPSMFIVASPTMKSTWMTESFTPLVVNLIKRILVVILDDIREAQASSNVARSVLVKQRVVEQNAEVRDGRVVRDKRQLADLRRALVHRNHVLQKLLVLFRLAGDRAARP